jgi:hypothetical protein
LKLVGGLLFDFAVDVGVGAADCVDHTR